MKNKYIEKFLYILAILALVAIIIVSNFYAMKFTHWIGEQL